MGIGAATRGPISCGTLEAVGKRQHWFRTPCARLQQAAAEQSIDGHFHGGLLHICSRDTFSTSPWRPSAAAAAAAPTCPPPPAKVYGLGAWPKPRQLLVKSMAPAPIDGPPLPGAAKWCQTGSWGRWVPAPPIPWCQSPAAHGWGWAAPYGGNGGPGGCATGCPPGGNMTGGIGGGPIGGGGPSMPSCPPRLHGAPCPPGRKPSICIAELTPCEMMDGCLLATLSSSSTFFFSCVASSFHW
jgi:hypothetical protein